MFKINGDAVANNRLYLASAPIRPVGMMDKITNTKFIYHHIMPFIWFIQGCVPNSEYQNTDNCRDRQSL